MPIRSGPRLRLALIATAWALALGGAAELAARAFLDLPALGVRADLFRDRAFGESVGNAKNAASEAFGMPVWTDESGFRIGRTVSPRGKEGLLILGDSVAFGPGVEEPLTLAGRLRERLPETSVYNASVIGHAASDYPNVAGSVLSQHPEIKRALLVFCLNDLSPRSAEPILSRQPAQTRLVESLRSWRAAAALNDALRSRSRLFLLLKNALTDPSRRYFLADLDPYLADEPAFSEGLRPIAELARILRSRGVALTVLIPPYEYQLRSKDPLHAAPQARLTGRLRKLGVRAVDLKGRFEAADRAGERLFLGGDPMHLSAAGHRLLFEAAWDELE